MAQNQTSICGLGRISPSPKIKFGFTCQPRNPNTEASRSCLPLPSPRMARPGRSRCSASRLHFPFLPPSGGVVGYSELCLERPFFAVYGQQVSDEFARYGQCSPVAISFLFLALVNQRQVRVPARR